MTGSHEVGGSIPPGSTRHETPRKPAKAPRRFLLGAPVAFVLILGAYAAFVLDAGVWCKADTPSDGVCTWGYWVARLQWWPFGRTQPLGWVPSWLVRDLGFSVVHPSFWLAALWSCAVVAGAAIRVGGSSPGLRRRLLFLATSTLLGVFVLPGVVGPLLLDRPERLQALVLPWPLLLDSMVDGPAVGGGTMAAVAWLALGAGVSLVALPLYVLRDGRRFCAVVCPYGALAETVGAAFASATVRWRPLERLRPLPSAVLVIAVVATVWRLHAAWGGGGPGPSEMARDVDHAYRVVVVLGALGVVGFGLSPLLGPRIWCRFLCPLGGAMDLLARVAPAVAVRRDGDCSGCGDCTLACSMGLDVEAVVRDGDLTNRSGPCIQCGDCVDACPDGVLSLVPLPTRSARRA